MFKQLSVFYFIFNMNASILLIFGIVNTVCAIYKIPEHDSCVLKVLLCDDYTKPLTPVDNSTLEMFKSIGPLNAVCDELSKFRACLKYAEIFCTENANLDVGFELLNNRRLAFDLCEHNSAHQHVYMMVEGCVNQYSHSAIEFCTDKAVETVGLDFDLGDYERECRFLGAMQHCHIAVVTDQCGSIAGNMLEKLVVFRGERDFMCIGYENEILKNLETFYATMDFYVQQYRNTVYQVETEDKAKRTDGVRSFKTTTQEASSQFHSRISPVSDENSASYIEYTNNRKEPLNLEMSYYPEKQPLSPLSENRLLDSEYTSQSTVQHERRFYEPLTDKISEIHSTNRIGLVSHVHKYGTVSEQNRISDHKRNFYQPEQSEYPIDTEIHLISSEEGNLENEFEVGDNYASQNHGDNPGLFLRDEMLGPRNSDESSTSAPPKSSFHSYRPYELYRPRVGETLEAEHHDMTGKDKRINDAEESSFNPNVFSFEDSTKKSYANYQYAEEMCPELPENISKLVNKPGRYSRVDFKNLADPIDKKSKHPKFSFSKAGKDIPSCNTIWKAEEHENSDSDIKQNQYEDIYVVTPSTEIEMPSVPKWTISEDADIKYIDENSQILNKKDDSQEFSEIPQESNSMALRLEDITKAINDKSYGEFISDHQNNKDPFAEKFIDPSIKHEDEFSPESELFSERSGQKYTNEMEEKKLMLLNYYWKKLNL